MRLIPPIRSCIPQRWPGSIWKLAGGLNRFNPIGRKCGGTAVIYLFTSACKLCVFFALFGCFFSRCGCQTYFQLVCDYKSVSGESWCVQTLNGVTPLLCKRGRWGGVAAIRTRIYMTRICEIHSNINTNNERGMLAQTHSANITRIECVCCVCVCVCQMCV